MDVKKVALLIGALVIAVVTAVMAKNMFAGAGADQANAAPVVPMGPKVLVARKALPVGTIIDAESLAFQAWPKELVQNAYYTEGTPEADMSKLLGTVVRNPVTAGQPLTRGALVGPNDRGFLAAALGPGMRAVTVPVSTTTGVGGFIFPGDRVDMMLTQDVTGGGEGPPLKVSETIVRNLRVLATDQRIDSKNEEGKTEVKTFTTVTLEATPRIAEKIAVSQSVGTLSLSLRSIADNTAELERAVAAGEVKVPAGANPAQERQMLLAIANRPADNNTTYVTGGDVSRFQRRSVPRAASAAPTSSDPMTKFANAMMGRQAGPMSTAASAGPAPVTGPVVRVSRGNNVTVVPVGGK
ncbi:Flp pilus assembly protein CpaB [Sphingomonas sp. LY29]|uniref:Flp pilus assembly protein CpaB n=1 Tax=unclassified Sphingomonas TaxID=196159 RepID=UPI002ADEB2EF|nr:MULTISPECIES: Flp pilus assembly protein CpaB [unclassified Sphingomonas]MEA1071483.1 Flp pilus assembly protein CpaB [Sphingomonas sp. LY160]WRP25838.1 Flp pilus assembly protein CpaB [Sphingomonas sp. LY29]